MHGERCNWIYAIRELRERRVHMRRDVFEILFSSRVLSHFYSPLGSLSASSSLSLSSSLRPLFLPFASLVFVSSLYSASFCFFLHRFTLLLLCFSFLFSIQLLYFYLLHFTVSAANCFLNLYHFPSLSFYSLLRFFFPVLERVFLFSYVSV